MLRTAQARLSPLISIILYLCSETAEYRGGTTIARPTHPSPKKTKDGWRLYPPDHPKFWSIGERLGQAIREARAAAPGDHGERRGPRPHVRRAHWHSFWRGPRVDPVARKIVLKWLPPLAVAMVDETMEH